MLQIKNQAEALKKLIDVEKEKAISNTFKIYESNLEMTEVISLDDDTNLQSMVKSYRADSKKLKELSDFT